MSPAEAHIPNGSHQTCPAHDDPGCNYIAPSSQDTADHAVRLSMLFVGLGHSTIWLWSPGKLEWCFEQCEPLGVVLPPVRLVHMFPTDQQVPVGKESTARPKVHRERGQECA